MLIKEFRVIMPLSLEEYHIAQLYSVAEASKNETGGGDGVEVVKNEPCNHDKMGSGQYTYKIFHLASKVPRFVRAIAPKGSLEVTEEAWNCYPHCKTVISNPGYMKEKFHITIETIHREDDTGKIDNIHNLPPELLAKREVVVIDIVNDHVEPRDYKEAEDPTKYHSEKSGRGPLQPNWMETSKPIMCCYKLVTCDFVWWGLQGRVEKLIQKTERRVFTNFHRQIFCWMDNWYGLTIDDIRAIEAKTKAELDAQRDKGEVRGTSEQ
ncbi:phosphatidylinositol transfer protein beta isoform-like [Dysidea avara]|uniref:phosphatidylinositol transfer protein beta isoform-like n=1 Tax=Dysidea avara TaxID=196820 RepID=UPI003321C964